jgi:Zn-dependent protease
MDGGRVLRALLWWLRGSRDGATATAALVGIGLAGLLAVAGVVAAFATHTWQFGWYLVLAAFLVRQCWQQYRALRPRTAAVAPHPLPAPPAAGAIA